MAYPVLENWWIKARWYVACLGTAGKVGVGLVVLSLIFFVAAILPQRQILQALQDKVQGMQLIRSNVAGQTVLNDNQALQVFYDFLPNSDSSPYWISELDRIAKENSVELNSSDYRLMMEKEAKLVRYEIQVPLRGTYPQIRAFIANALQSIPTLVLADINVKRETIQMNRVEARLSMFLYLKSE